MRKKECKLSTMFAEYDADIIQIEKILDTCTKIINSVIGGITAVYRRWQQMTGGEPVMIDTFDAIKKEL